MFFTFLEGRAVLYSKQGNYKQVQLAKRAGFLYAALGPNTFVKLLAAGATTNPTFRWEWIEDQDLYLPDKMGRLTVNTGR